MIRVLVLAGSIIVPITLSASVSSIQDEPTQELYSSTARRSQNIEIASTGISQIDVSGSPEFSTSQSDDKDKFTVHSCNGQIADAKLRSAPNAPQIGVIANGEAYMPTGQVSGSYIQVSAPYWSGENYIESGTGWIHECWLSQDISSSATINSDNTNLVLSSLGRSRSRRSRSRSRTRSSSRHARRQERNTPNYRTSNDSDSLLWRNNRDLLDYYIAWDVLTDNGPQYVPVPVPQPEPQYFPQTTPAVQQPAVPQYSPAPVQQLVIYDEQLPAVSYAPSINYTGFSVPPVTRKPRRYTPENFVDWLVSPGPSWR